MANFFSNIDEFKQTGVGGASDNDESFLVSIGQMIVHAEGKYLGPWLGTKTLDTLRVLHPDAELNSANAALTALIQRSLAWFALYEYSFVSTVRHNEEGMKMVEGVPYRYIAQENREKCLEVGYDALEACLLYLDTHLNDFTDWRDGMERRKHKAVFLNTATAFRAAYSVKINRYTLDLLRGIIEDIEYEVIELRLPRLFFVYLKNKFFETQDMANPIEQGLIFLIQKTIATFTLSEAMHRQYVELHNGEVVQPSYKGDQSSKTHTTASRNDMERSAWHTEGWGNTHLMRLRKYIETNAAYFPLCFSPDTTGGTNTDADAWGQKPMTDTAATVPIKRNKAAIL